MRKPLCIAAVVLGLLTASCAGSGAKYPTTDALTLSRVVLYRNGIGYFERVGHVDGDVLRIKVRKDQVNDLLKTLTVVKRSGGQAVSISMPLDPQTWANAALATLAPGRGSLAEILDTLRGTRVELLTSTGSASGRIAMVEEIEEPGPQTGGGPGPVIHDHNVTLLDGSNLRVVKLSKVKTITLLDGDLAMQFNRTLDASAGEGMFQQVEVAIRLAGADAHDLLVSYVVPAPMWKPTYRVVLPESGKGKALLQAWAVVDNTSGEDWTQVQLALTAGAPIAFRYDLHTPRDVDRPDLTETSVRKRAAVALGETTYARDEVEKKEAPAEAETKPAPEPSSGEEDETGIAENQTRVAADRSVGTRGAGGGSADHWAPAKSTRPPRTSSVAPPPPPASPKPQQQPSAPTLDLESLRQSTLARARASAVSGLSRFDISTPVTVPDGTSTMVALVNQEVDGEETFLFRPGGAGVGYEANPYRVVRFRNSTPFALESGPISIYSGGSFVGEGISEVVGANTSVTIPFAVETGMMVTSTTQHDGEQMRLLKIVRGVLEVENFSRMTTVWNVKAQTRRDGFTVLIRHPKAGSNYQLAPRPEGTEDLVDAYLIPVKVPAGQQEASVKVVEQTPSRLSISIWEGRAVPLLETLLVSTSITPEVRARIEPIVRLRQEIGRIDTQVEGLTRQRQELDQRAEETRRNLEALKKDPAAGALRKRLSDRLEQFTKDGDRLSREIVELQSKRMEKKIELEDLLQNLDFTAPVPATPGVAQPTPVATPAVAVPPSVPSK